MSANASIVACVLLAASPAFAVDGEILINQAKVNAGGITPGDTAGFPVTVSRPGRYKLSSNLVVPSSFTGIVVTANDVTIDLNGFTIRTSSPGNLGVAAVKVERLRVMNGTLTGFDADNGNAILVQASRYGVVENVRILDSTTGISGTQEFRIRNNTIANARFGVQFCNGCVIENNIITGAIEVAIYSTNDAMVLGNVIVGSGSYGLSGNGTGYGNNILVGNNGGGAQVFGSVSQLHPNVCDPACP